jgi:hypothetical protein
MLVGEGRGSEDGKDAGEDGDGLLVLGEVEMLVGGVVQVGIAGPIGDNGQFQTGPTTFMSEVPLFTLKAGSTPCSRIA